MHTDMTRSSVSPKGVSGELGRLDKDKNKSTGDAGDESMGDFSSLLMNVGAGEPSVPEAKSIQEVSQEAVTENMPTEGKNQQTDIPPTAEGGPALLPAEPSVSMPGSELALTWLAGMQAAAWGGLKGEQTGLNKGVDTVTLGRGLDPASLAAQTAQAAQEQNKPTSGHENHLGDAVSSSALPLLAHGQAKLGDLKMGDSKNRTSLAVDAEASFRSDVFVKLERNEVASTGTSTNVSTLDFFTQHMGSRAPQGGEGGAFGSPSLPVTGGGFDGVRLVPMGISASAEIPVAHQVNYWLGSDVQSAELKMDGLGQSPVEVSITMQGQEARVAFRAEQVETRQIIEGTMSHLKDLLKSEGLVLAGVSIGSAGADGASSQDRKPKPQVRRVGSVLPDLRLGQANARVSSSTGGALDLFV